MNTDKLKEELLDNQDNVEMLRHLVSEVNGWNSGLEEYDYQENDEYFFDNYFQNAHDAVRAVCYGEYNYMDDYVKFNAYGNLESKDEYGLDKELQDNAEEIIDAYVDLVEEDKLDPEWLIESYGLEVEEDEE